MPHPWRKGSGTCPDLGMCPQPIRMPVELSVQATFGDQGCLVGPLLAAWAASLGVRPRDGWQDRGKGAPSLLLTFLMVPLRLDLEALPARFLKSRWTAKIGRDGCSSCGGGGRPAR